MTAIIGVMNKHAVAIAADSAVTLGGGKKVLNSANKLFSLSKHHPVAIAIYGNAENVQYTAPFVNSVASLEKEDLSDFAESLITLTSLKRKVSPDQETVGGPDDNPIQEIPVVELSSREKKASEKIQMATSESEVIGIISEELVHSLMEQLSF